MWRDLERLCEKHGFPWRKPSSFPRNPLLAARAATVGLEAEWLPRYVEAVYRANFERDEDIASRDVVAAMLAEAGASPDEVLSRAETPEVKGRLREATERARALGIFGAPSFVVGEELFFGQDRLEDALEYARR